jgi:hypothetical protein
MVLPASHGVSRAPRYSGTSPQARTLSPTRLSLSTARLSMRLRLERRFLTCGVPCRAPTTGPTTPGGQRRQPVTSTRFGLVPVRSPLLGESRLISVPPATEMFHFAGLPATGYVFTCRSRSFLTWWLPHSEIPGSQLARSSPRLIAACHVLHRRLPPRHPPCALTHFNPNFASRPESHALHRTNTAQPLPRTQNGVRGENLVSHDGIASASNDLFVCQRTQDTQERPKAHWSLATE